MYQQYNYEIEDVKGAVPLMVRDVDKNNVFTKEEQITTTTYWLSQMKNTLRCPHLISIPFHLLLK
jgi:hypothetical protein